MIGGVFKVFPAFWSETTGWYLTMATDQHGMPLEDDFIAEKLNLSADAFHVILIALEADKGVAPGGDEDYPFQTMEACQKACDVFNEYVDVGFDMIIIEKLQERLKEKETSLNVE